MRKDYKVYALLANGDVVVGSENVANVTTPKSINLFYRGANKTMKPVVSWDYTTENYEHLVALFGARVPTVVDANAISLQLLKDNKIIMGMVSDASIETARDKRVVQVVTRSTDEQYPFVNTSGTRWKYCAPVDGQGEEITTMPIDGHSEKPRDRELLQAGDSVECVTDDLPNLSKGVRPVYFNGSEMIVFDDEGFELPVQEQIELGYFNLMPE